MSNAFAVLTNLLAPAVLAVALGIALSLTVATVVVVLYTTGGIVTLFIEKGGGEHWAVVLTGWYSGPLFGFIGWVFRL